MTDAVSHSATDVAERLGQLMTNAGVPEKGRGAVLATLCGVSEQATGRWLAGRGCPGRDHVRMIAAKYGTSPGFLLFGETAAPIPDLPEVLAPVVAVLRWAAADESERTLLSAYRNGSANQRAALLAVARAVKD